ncbi:MAG: glycine oxidase ThiO [Byssovorax sp.]
MSPAMTEVLVIGGGVIGSAVALALAEKGRSVTVIERGSLDPTGRGPDGSTAAAGIVGAQLEGLHGDCALSRLCLQSRDRYASWIAAITERTGRDVELRPTGVTVLAYDLADVRALEAASAWQALAGYRVEHLDAAGVRAIEPALSNVAAGGVRFPDDPRIDPPALVSALRLAASLAGVTFRTGATVARVVVRDGRASGVVLDDGTTISAAAVVIAAGSWSALIGETSLAGDAVQPARGQMIELHVDAPVLRGVVEAPDCYLSPRDDGRLLVGSTVELVGFREGVTAGAVRDLLAAALRLVPSLHDARVSRTWAGFRPKSHDDRPLIGSVGIEGLVIATGHFRNGVLLAPITGEIVAAMLTGGALPVDVAPFAPRRLLSSAVAS